MKKFGRGLNFSPSKKVLQKIDPTMGPYDPHFLLQNHFPFKNTDVFQKAELIIFIFGHATAISSSEIKVFQFFLKIG